MESETTFLTVPQVAWRLRVKATTVRVWIKAGVLEADKVIEGKHYRYRIKCTVVDAMQGKTSEL